MNPLARPLALVSLVLLGACSPGRAQSDDPESWSPTTVWRDLPSLAFERWLERELPRGSPVTVSDEALEDLSRALDAGPAEATRAALILAHSLDPSGYEALLARLERRVAGPGRADDSGDCTAAAALGRRPLAARTADRLLALADGDRPHPDLEVRTECALAALELGREESLGVLVRVLRIDTPSEAREGPLTDSPTTAWARGRAAEGLHRHLGLPYRDWTDAPIEERERRADELERQLQER